MGPMNLPVYNCRPCSKNVLVVANDRMTPVDGDDIEWKRNSRSQVELDQWT